MRPRLAIALLLTACSTGTADFPADDHDLQLVEGTFALAGPDAWLTLLDLPEWYLEDPTCPAFEASGDRERWTGDCSLADGTRIDGVLERFGDESGGWISGDRFRALSADGDLLLYLDGAAEVVSYGQLLVIEAALSACGGSAPDCEAEGGPITVDLVYTLFPAIDFPDRYDLSVSGVVATALEVPASVNGTWSVDMAACAYEPVSGTMVIDLERPHVLDFDGMFACDSCANQVTDGEGETLACADWMP